MQTLRVQNRRSLPLLELVLRVGVLLLPHDRHQLHLRRAPPAAAGLRFVARLELIILAVVAARGARRLLAPSRPQANSTAQFRGCDDDGEREHEGGHHPDEESQQRRGSLGRPAGTRVWKQENL